MEIFEDNDRGYKRWIGRHPNGYVLNTERGRGNKYMRLHRATCRWIKPTDDRQWTNQYIKVCSTDALEIIDWARRERGGEPEWCGTTGCRNT